MTSRSRDSERERKRGDKEAMNSTPGLMREVATGGQMGGVVGWGKSEGIWWTGREWQWFEEVGI